MRPIALSEEIAVGEVPSDAEIAILAKAGFRALLNVQPDGEVERLTAASAAKHAATAAGLAFAHVPIESRLPPEPSIQQFASAMAELPRPIYAYCYSGGRAAAAWALAMAPKSSPADIVKALEAAGYDASSLKPALERRHAGLPAFEMPPPVEPTTATVTPAPSAATAPETIVLPRAASAGGFAVSG